MLECERLATDQTRIDVAIGFERRVECLLALAALERSIPDRDREAVAVLADAERVIRAFFARLSSSSEGAGESGQEDGSGTSKSTQTNNGTQADPRVGVIQQRLLSAREADCLSAGAVEVAVRCWTEAVLRCGDRMDTGAVKSSLISLCGQAKLLCDSSKRDCFSRDLLRRLDSMTTVSLEISTCGRGKRQKTIRRRQRRPR